MRIIRHTLSHRCKRMPSRPLSSTFSVHLLTLCTPSFSSRHTEPSRSSQGTSLTTTPSRYRTSWTWTLLRPSKCPAHGAGADLPGTRAPLSPGRRGGSVRRGPGRTTSPCACSSPRSSWEPSSARKASPSRMSPSRRSQSKTCPTSLTGSVALCCFIS